MASTLVFHVLYESMEGLKAVHHPHLLQSQRIHHLATKKIHSTRPSFGGRIWVGLVHLSADKVPGLQTCIRLQASKRE